MPEKSLCNNTRAMWIKTSRSCYFEPVDGFRKSDSLLMMPFLLLTLLALPLTDLHHNQLRLTFKISFCLFSLFSSLIVRVSITER